MKTAQQAWDRARTDLSEIKRRHADERHTLARRQAEEARPFEEAAAEAKVRWEQEQSETANHPDEGRRVFRDEDVYATRWSRKPSGTKRITGVVEVWRVGASAQRGFDPRVGTPVVRLLKADGTPGVKCEYLMTLMDSSKWQFEDGEPSRVPARKQEVI